MSDREGDGFPRIGVSEWGMSQATPGEKYEAWDIEGPGFKLVGVAGQVDSYDRSSSVTVIWADGSAKPVTSNLQSKR